MSVNWNEKLGGNSTGTMNMLKMTDDENICRNASMLVLGDKYEEQIKAFKAAVSEVAKAKGTTYREAAAHLGDTAMKQGEPPEVIGMFIAAGAELAIAT